ncbi:late competence development ComFB family protein [Pseudodesulfovibrio sediminis]|uniref:Late competence development protein ComFB n=1 Tax=Pseudodesulfovibrio sediminis TaxID=2810563 RepID=A0ABM7P4U7_9BACT|nr:late competence development ComFB family protein [Pseudodesulfovibrio sediminis]BCS87929.1 hypothetical protein PSDVSF_11710 [Pseudodesulfovibrio sediminis]
MSCKPLIIKDVDVSSISNRNKRRVVELIPVIIDEYYPDFIFEDLDIQDIFALSLNLIPAAYAQTGSIIISNRISDYEINNKIRIAIERVLDNPTRGGN